MIIDLDATLVTAHSDEEHAKPTYERGIPDVLGVVGKGYRPIQNAEHADLLSTLVDESGAHFETAGSPGLTAEAGRRAVGRSTPMRWG